MLMRRAGYIVTIELITTEVDGKTVSLDKKRGTALSNIRRMLSSISTLTFAENTIEQKIISKN
jgi:hypothetical protein